MQEFARPSYTLHRRTGAPIGLRFYRTVSNSRWSRRDVKRSKIVTMGSADRPQL
jgi:hypothetical protein